MTTTSVTASAPRGTVAPSAPPRRGLLAVIMLGPLSVAILRAVLPYSDNDKAATVAAKVAAHQGAQTAVLWLDLIALATLVPGVIAVGLLATRHARRLGLCGTALAVVGFSFLAVISTVDFAALAGATSGADPASTAKTIDELTSSPTAIVGTAGFIVGHVVGLILIGVALLRARVIPVPAAWMLIISAPLHLVFAVIVPSNALSAIAWVLTAIGFAAAGRAIVARSVPV